MLLSISVKLVQVKVEPQFPFLSTRQSGKVPKTGAVTCFQATHQLYCSIRIMFSFLAVVKGVRTYLGLSFPAPPSGTPADPLS